MSAVEPEGPPADPEAWSDEQWIAWLESTDDAAPDATAAPPPPLLRRVRESAPGIALGAAMTGLYNAIYGRKEDQIVIVQEAGGEPDEDEPFEVRLDPDDPQSSVVVVRDEDGPPTPFGDDA